MAGRAGRPGRPTKQIEPGAWLSATGRLLFLYSIYGQVGEFLGFEMMSGNLYSTPNIDAMHAISQASPQRGLYVRAEERDAVERVLQFTVGGRLRNPKFPGTLFASLSLFGIVVLVGARVLQ